MKNKSDFGYFGKGTTGYAHYMQTYNQCYPNNDNNLFSGFSIFVLADWFMKIYTRILPIFFGFSSFFFFFVFLAEPSFEALKTVGICIGGFALSIPLYKFLGN